MLTKIGETVYDAGDYATRPQEIIVDEDNIGFITEYWNHGFFDTMKKACKYNQESRMRYHAWINKELFN